MELTGKLYTIGDVVNVSETFRRRSFVIEFRNPTDGPRWVQHAQFELTKADVLEIDKFQIGDEITVTFEVTGRNYNKLGKELNFTSLHALKLAAVNTGTFIPGTPTGRQPKAEVPFQGAISPVTMLDDDMGNAKIDDYDPNESPF